MPRPLRRSTDRNEEAQIAPRPAAAWRLAVARRCFKLCRLSPHPRCVFHRSAQETDNAIKLDVASPAERAARWVLLGVCLFNFLVCRQSRVFKTGMTPRFILMKRQQYPLLVSIPLHPLPVNGSCSHASRASRTTTGIRLASLLQRFTAYARAGAMLMTTCSPFPLTTTRTPRSGISRIAFPLLRQ